MNFNVGIAYLAAGVTAGIAVMALWRRQLASALSTTRY